MQRDLGLPLILFKFISAHSPELLPIYTEFVQGDVLSARRKCVQATLTDPLACYLLALSYLKQAPIHLDLARHFFAQALLAMEVIHEPWRYLSLKEIYDINHPYLTQYVTFADPFGEQLKAAFEGKTDLPLPWLIDRTLDYLANDIDRK